MSAPTTTVGALLDAFDLLAPFTSDRSADAAVAAVDTYGPAAWLQVAGVAAAVDRARLLDRAAAAEAAADAETRALERELANRIETGSATDEVRDRLLQIQASIRAVRHVAARLQDTAPQDGAPAAPALAFAGGVCRPCKRCRLPIWEVRIGQRVGFFDGCGASHAVTCGQAPAHANQEPRPQSPAAQPPPLVHHGYNAKNDARKLQNEREAHLSVRKVANPAQSTDNAKKQTGG